MTADVLVAMDGTPSHMKMPSASKLRPSPAIPGSMEAAIKMWLQVGNVQKLQQVILFFLTILGCLIRNIQNLLINIIIQIIHFRLFLTDMVGF